MAPVWVVAVFTGLAAALVPWVVWLSMTLPHTQRAAHYRLAWLGFDVLLAATLAGIAIAALRDSPRLEQVAAAAAALLTVDAWFDVMTSNGLGESLVAILLAVAVELPLAMVCLWVARHAGAVRDRCADLLRSRRHSSR